MFNNTHVKEVALNAAANLLVVLHPLESSVKSTTYVFRPHVAKNLDSWRADQAFLCTATEWLENAMFYYSAVVCTARRLMQTAWGAWTASSRAV